MGKLYAYNIYSVALGSIRRRTAKKRAVLLPTTFYLLPTTFYLLRIQQITRAQLLIIFQSWLPTLPNFDLRLACCQLLPK